MFVETMLVTDMVSNDRLWFNRTANQGVRGRPYGGISIGLNSDKNWKANIIKANDNLVFVKSSSICLMSCYFSPGTPVDTILAEIVDAMLLRPSDIPTLIGGDFNCRLDKGNRGQELQRSLSDIGFVCISDPCVSTYISHQGTSVIDLVFVESLFESDFKVSVKPSLEAKHQHVEVHFVNSIGHFNKRVKAIRKVDRSILIDSISPETVIDILGSDCDPTVNVTAAVNYVYEGVKISQTVKRARKSKPWFDSQCFELKREVRKSYRNYRRDPALTRPDIMQIWYVFSNV
jgi:hypothetical protein